MATDTNADGTVYVPISKLQKYADSIRKGLQGGGGAMRKAVIQWAAIYRGFAKERFVKLSRGGGGGDWKPLKPSTIARRRKGQAKTIITKTESKTNRTPGQKSPGPRTSKRKKAISKGVRSIIQGARGLGKGAAKLGRGRRSRRSGLRASRKGLAKIARGTLMIVLSARSARRKGSKKTGSKKGTNRKTIAQGAVSILWDTGTLIGALDPQASIAPGSLTEFIPFGVRVGYGGTAKHPSTKGTIAFIAAVHQHGSGNIPARPIIVPPDEKTTGLIVKVTERALSEEWKQAVG